MVLVAFYIANIRNQKDPTHASMDDTKAKKKAYKPYVGVEPTTLRCTE